MSSTDVFVSPEDLAVAGYFLDDEVRAAAAALEARGIRPLAGGAFANGQLPSSALSPIAGGGQLEHRAAAAWNAMAAHIFKATGVRIAVTGPDSSYRTLDRQRYYYALYLSGRGNLAAVPGTSNHGWGLAVDVPPYVQPLIARYGAPFGWQKQWSDAPSEPWHFRYASGHYGGPDPGIDYAAGPSYPTLRRGDTGRAVRRMQKRLVVWNDGLRKPDVDGSFGPGTEAALEDFQRVHRLRPVDGICGPKTWRELRRRDYLKPDERNRVNRLKLLRRGEVRKGEEAERKRLTKWIEKRRHSIRQTALKHGWTGEDRGKRYRTLTGVLGARD